MFWELYKLFMAYALFIALIWAGAAIAVECMLKSRPKLDTSKRQRKLFIHTITPKGEKVK